MTAKYEDAIAKKSVEESVRTPIFMVDQPYATFTFVKDETGQLFLVRKVDRREASRVKKIK